jgi:hypothetical protein
LLTGKKLLSSPADEDEPIHIPSGASSGPRLEHGPRDMAKDYYTLMKSRAVASREYVSLLKRINSRMYQSKDEACKAIKDEIYIQGTKYRRWLQRYSRNSGLLDIYNSPEEEIKRACDDIEKCRTEIDRMLQSADTYDQKALEDQLVKLDAILDNCCILAEIELVEKLGVAVE